MTLLPSDGMGDVPHVARQRSRRMMLLRDGQSGRSRNEEMSQMTDQMHAHEAADRWSRYDPTAHRSDSPSREPGRAIVEQARWVVLGSAGAMLLLGLMAGTLAVNPIALGIAMLLFMKVLDEKRWARNLLIAQQLISALAGPLVIIAVGSGSAGGGAGVLVLVGIIATLTGITAAGMLMSSKVATLVAPR